VVIICALKGIFGFIFFDELLIFDNSPKQQSKNENKFFTPVYFSVIYHHFLRSIEYSINCNKAVLA